MIPKIIHFIYGLDSNFGGKEFSFAHWAAIKSAKKHNPGYRVLFWHKYLPENHYFNDVREGVELMQIEPPDSIFGNPLLHVAHKADVLRLQVLSEYGGIYLDMDTITVRGFDDLLAYDCVMGRESLDGHGEIGLCNAVIMAMKGSRFIQEWGANYKSFRSRGRDQYWNEHSVQLPMKLAGEMPDAIKILPKEAFFLPDWSGKGLQDMFFRTMDFPNAHVHHLWESVSWGALRTINEFNVRHVKCTYTSILNRALYHEIDSLSERRKAWIDAQLQSRSAHLNIGCGPNRDSRQVNCDLHPEAGADLVFDVRSDSWPIPSDSVAQVTLSHVLEHLSGDLRTFFRELYRVTRHGADIFIKVPHPRHDWFLIDPTHAKAWHEQSFLFLDKMVCLSWYFSGDSKTPLALYWGVDFQVENVTLFRENNEVDGKLQRAFNSSNSDEMRHFLNNYISEIQVKLKTRKSVD